MDVQWIVTNAEEEGGYAKILVNMLEFLGGYFPPVYRGGSYTHQGAEDGVFCEIAVEGWMVDQYKIFTCLAQMKEKGEAVQEASRQAMLQLQKRHPVVIKYSPYKYYPASVRGEEKMELKFQEPDADEGPLIVNSAEMVAIQAKMIAKEVVEYTALREEINKVQDQVKAAKELNLTLKQKLAQKRGFCDTCVKEGRDKCGVEPHPPLKIERNLQSPYAAHFRLKKPKIEGEARTTVPLWIPRSYEGTAYDRPVNISSDEEEEDPEEIEAEEDA